MIGAITIWDGKGEFNEGHTALGAVHIFLGLASIGAALLLLTTFAAAGFIVGLIIGIILLAIAIFKHNKVQDWLENAQYFGDGKLKPFKGMVSQMQAFAKLGEG